MKPIVPEQYTHAEPEIAAICRLRRGMFRGVHVDLRHELLSPDDWEASAGIFSWGSPPASGPFLFPGAKSIEETRKHHFGALDGVEPIILREGDRVSVARVETTIEAAGPFDSQHDVRRRYAILQVQRFDGAVEVAEGHMVEFLDQLRLRNAPLLGALNRVARRICSALGIKDIWDRSFLPTDGTLAEGVTKPRRFNGLSPADAALWTMQNVDALRSSLYRQAREAGATEAQAAAMAKTADMMLENAAMAGYFLGRAETRKQEKIANSSAANLQRGRTSRLSPRTAELRQLAADAWAENPTATITGVAKIIRSDAEDPADVLKKIRPVCPPTSPSYKSSPEGDW